MSGRLIGAGRMPHLLVWLAVASAAASAGCKEKREPEPVARALAGLMAMPGSVDQVLGVDVGRLSRSPLVERAVGALLAADPDLARDLDALLAGCQLDVQRDLSHLWLGMDRDAGDRVVLVVHGRLSEGQLGTCVGKAISSVGGRLSGERVAGRTHYHVDQAEGRPDVWFAVAGDGVVVVATSADFLAEAIGDGAKLGSDPAMSGLVARAGVGHTLWFAGAVPPEVGQGLAKTSGGAIGAPRSMFGHADLDGAMAAELGVVMSSAEAANHALSLIKPQMQTLALVAQGEGLGWLVSRIGADVAGDTLLLRLAVSEEEVRALVGTPIDSGGAGAQNATPSAQQGAQSDGQGDPDSGNEAPVR